MRQIELDKMPISFQNCYFVSLQTHFKLTLSIVKVYTVLSLVYVKLCL